MECHQKLNTLQLIDSKLLRIRQRGTIGQRGMYTPVSVHLSSNNI